MYSSCVSRLKSLRRFSAFIVLLLVLGGAFSHAHSGKARYHVIIDTDAAIDDLRSICLLLASPEFEVLAITTSDGIVEPEQGLAKVKSLLKSFGHEGIPTGAGQTILKEIPPWRSFNQKILWGKEKNGGMKNGESAVHSILSAIELEEEPVLFICLGGMTNLAQSLKAKPQYLGKIDRIIWYNDSITPLSGTNYLFDKDAAKAVLSLPVSIEIVSNREDEISALSPEFLRSIGSLHSSYAEKITAAHNTKEVMQRMKTGHLKFWDDLLPVYLLNPEFFLSKTSRETDHHKLIKMQDWEGFKARYLEILTSRNRVDSKVFEGFPDSPEFYAEDVRPTMKSIIDTHGIEEWRIGVLTNEIHGHLGIYAIVGAKMGLRARQYYHVGVDDISVISYAGTTPPLSCMNDGLQVSTGGTLGHGLITVSPVPPYKPEATFTFKQRTVRFRLKEQYWKIIKDDIKKGIELYGVNTKNYWKYVRELALNYWLKWNRLEIFERE